MNNQMEFSKELKGKKILHVLDRSIPNLSGYSIRSKYIIEFQRRQGLSPCVVSSPVYEHKPSFEIINQIEYHRAYEPLTGIQKKLMSIPFVGQKLIMNQFEKKIDRVVQEKQVDLIHAHSPSLCGHPAMNVARKNKLPFVYEVRAFWEDAAVDRKRFTKNSIKYRISQWVEQKLFDNADAVVPICNGLKSEIHQRTGKDNLFVIKNGVDTNLFLPKAEAQHINKKYNLESQTVVGFIGSFFTFEGLADLIKSASLILNENPNVTFMIVGAGVEDENLRKLAREKGLLGTKIIFTGRVPHEEVGNYYSVIDILVYPRISRRITELVTPLKPLEAMSMEKAVIASDVGGLYELIDDGENGLLYKAGIVGDLAEKLIKMTNDGTFRENIGKRARKKVIQDRSWEKIIQGYEEVYRFALENYKALNKM